MRPLLSLTAIFKDEAGNVHKTLESVKPFIDCWTIIDTGSVDGTQTIIDETMAGLPGKRWNLPFVDFATTRNEALLLDDLNNQPVFTLTLSGDEVLTNGTELRAFLESHRDSKHGAYHVEMQAGATSWTFPRILRTDAKWRYVGEVHESPHSPEGQPADPSLCPLSPAKIIHTVSDVTRRSKRVREYDLPMLTKIVNDESKELAERAPKMYFLAEAHTSVANDYEPKPGSPWWTHMFAAMGHYWRYAQYAETSDSPAHDMPKAMHAYAQYLAVAERLGIYNPEEMLARVEAIAEAAPELPEIHFMRAKYAALLDAKKGLFLAEEAARIARMAKLKPTYMTTDSRIEWKALCGAYDCAKQIGRDAAYLKELAERAVAAGAPAEVFEQV